MIYGQRDPRWASQKIGKSSSTIGLYGCTITAIAMIADLTPDEVNTRLTAVNGYQVDLILWSKINEAIPCLKFEWRGYQYDNAKVKKAIDENGVCLVEVDFDGSIATPRDRHWVLYKGSQRLCDPWTGREAATSKYPRTTGYAVIKVYNKPEESSMTKDETNALKVIKEFKEEAGHGNLEGAANAAVGAVGEKSLLEVTAANLNKEIETLKKLQEDLGKRMTVLETELKAKTENEADWQKQLSTANKTVSKLEKDLEFFKPYKARYEDKCKESVKNQKPSVLFHYWFKKVFNVPEKVQP